MNSRTTPTLLSLIGAAIMTIAMLAAIDGLATSQLSAAQIAHAAAASAKA